MKLSKYVEEKFLPVWFVFGTHDSGEVDVACVDGDVFSKISKEKARLLIIERQRHIEEVERIIHESID